MSTLEVSGLRLGYGEKDVLAGVDLVVPAGSVAAVLGPSGCGKTTLLRAVAGFERPSAGTVRLSGRTVVDGTTFVPAERRRVGLVPQEGALFPHLDVAANVAFGVRRTGRRERAVRVEEMLDLVGLAGLGRRMPSQLSGGQQQRVALARALAPRPEIVLLDEPFGALDAGLRAALREDVVQVLRASGATAVLVTHDQEEALSVADLVAVLREGVVVQAGAPQEVYRAPSDAAVATFVGEAAVLAAGPAAAGRVRTVLGDLPVLGTAPDGASGRVVVRPEQILLRPAGSGGPAAHVVGSVFHGHDSTVRLRVDVPGGTFSLDARVQGVAPQPGPVALAVDGAVPFYAGS